MPRLVVCVTLLAVCVCVCVRALTRTKLLEFGQSVGDRELPPGGDHSSELELLQPLLFFSGTYQRLYINTNGFVATSQPTEESQYLGSNSPAEFGMIAPLMGNLDTSDGVGKVYFREDTRPAILRQAAEHINRAFPEDDEVNPTHTLVATWDNVTIPESTEGDGSRDGLQKKRNTFQLVIASGEKASYAIMLYPRDGIQFFHTPTVGGSELLHAFFNQGLVKYFVRNTHQGERYPITTDDRQSVRDLSEKTNSGMRGVWVFEIGTSPHFSNIAPGEVTDVPPEHHVDTDRKQREGRVMNGHSERQQQIHTLQHYGEAQQHMDHSVKAYGDQLAVETVQFEPQQPQYQPQNPHVLVVDESDINVDVFSYNYETCANNRQKCSGFADCRDYSGGYCCHCRPGFYGNGKHCVAEGKPQRMNGKVSGRVYVGSNSSPVEFSNNDLHSYVVANDGRAYVAISAIPASLGPSLIPLSSIGGVIGWAFALEQPGYENGFSIIGGEFTRQADVTFQPGNEKLTIKQQFKGIDEHDHLVVSTELEGTVPEVPRGATVQIEPYNEIYQYNSGLITSSSTREYTISLEDGSTQARTYHWRQSIYFQGCPHDEASRAALAPQQLSVEQIFVLYDPSSQILRYAMSNKVGSIHNGEPEKNACYTGRHGCDTNAVCKPGQGDQFTCECATGFRGDGRICYDIDECRENSNICDRNAVCSNQPGTYRCQCNDGYHFAGDGHTCIEVARPVDPCQQGIHKCDIPERARCSYTGGSSFLCTCLPGFQGDGRVCHDIDECQPGRCHRDALCYNTEGSFTCRCKPGFRGDGFHCSTEREKTQCEHHRDSALGSAYTFGPRGPRPLPGQYVPTCDPAGNYEPTQCHASIAQCWCVDRNGVEVPGTRTGPGSRPMCIEPTMPLHPVGPTPRPSVQPLPPGTHLLFAQSGKIEHIPLDGYKMKKNEAKAVLHLPERVVIGVAFDCVDKMVYWTDITGPSISKASLHGGEPVVVIRTDLESPEGIAIDHLGRTMFWTDSVSDRIEVATLDGSQRRVLFDTDLVNPRAIITAPANGYLYWADWNRDAPKIESSYMDGSNRRILVKENLALPNGLTYDSQSSLLCWADAGTHKLECMNPALNDRRNILEGIQYPFGMTSYGKNLYYTDWKRDAVIMADRHTGQEADEFQPQKQSRLYGITTAYAECPAGQNYCAVNNGGCTHLCLASPSGRSCLCPDNAVGVSCVERDGRREG